METKNVIPLFPLGLVLMPGMPLPLHIFEERYKIMIAECLAEELEFGIVFMDGTKISSVGCTARILKVLKQYETGEMDIITFGKNRFYVKEVLDRQPYLEAAIVYYDDEPEGDAGELNHLAREGIKSLQDLDRLTGDPGDYGRPEELGAKRVSFLISSHSGFTPAEKQKFLEMTSTRTRLENSIKSLQKVFHRTLLTHDIHKIIGGNGNIKKFLKKHGLEN